MGIANILPPPDDLLQLEPEDLAFLLLKYLLGASAQEMSRYNFCLQPEFRSYSQAKSMEIIRAVSEAWAVLEREGLLAVDPNDSNGNWMFITRRGKSLLAHGDVKTFLLGHLLPEALLDPTLVTKVRPLFLRGDYDTAVFAAFKEVEVRVRAAAALPAEMLGVQLMRTAFDSTNGPLADVSKPTAERDAAAHLFSGAIGLFKNPSSHRSVEYDGPEAADLIRFANYLIKWAERQRPLSTVS